MSVGGRIRPPAVGVRTVHSVSVKDARAGKCGCFLCLSFNEELTFLTKH